MSDPAPRHHLHLLLPGCEADSLADLIVPESATDRNEILHLTPANAAEALHKIFASDTIATWGPL